MKYYTEWHFGREEACMDRRNCPMAGSNKAAHVCFLQTFQDFATEYKNSGGSEDIARRMYAALTDWLVNHIQRVDTSLAGLQEPEKQAT
jgi:hemerythrin